jgi:tRNA pseudouridine55 synthase
MFGLLNIHKPAGLTSRDVVNRVQRLVKPHKVGHAGTLDPLATGVLVIAIGPATRLVEYIQRMPKTYRAVFLIGRTSDTEDVEGKIEELMQPPIPTREQIEAACSKFIGTIEQRPPAYSALKIAGRRAHELARRGDAVELSPRQVQIHSIEIVRYVYPELELLIRCGSGTYVRSLGRDLAESRGTGAVMEKLCREAIGPFNVRDAMGLDDLSLAAISDRLLSPTLAVSALEQVVVDADEQKRLSRGQSIVNRFGAQAGETAARNSAGQLVAVLVTTSPHELRPTKCFVAG